MKLLENELTRIKKEVIENDDDNTRCQHDYQYWPPLDYYNEEYRPLDEEDYRYGDSCIVRDSGTYDFRYGIFPFKYLTQLLPDIQSVVRRWDFLEYKTPDAEPWIITYVNFIQEYKMLHRKPVLFLILVPYGETYKDYDPISDEKALDLFFETSKVYGLKRSMRNIAEVQTSLDEKLEYMERLIQTGEVDFIFYQKKSISEEIQAKVFSCIYDHQNNPCVLLVPELERLYVDFKSDANLNGYTTKDASLGLVEYTARGIQVVECTKYSSNAPEYPYRAYFERRDTNWHLSYVEIPESTNYNDTSMEDTPGLYTNSLQYGTILKETKYNERWCDYLEVSYNQNAVYLYEICQTIYYYLQEMLFRHDISYRKSICKVVYIPFENGEKEPKREFLGHYTDTTMIHGTTPENVMETLEKLNLFNRPNEDSTNSNESTTLDIHAYTPEFAFDRSDYDGYDPDHVPYEIYVFLDGRLFEETVRTGVVKDWLSEYGGMEKLANQLKIREGHNFHVHFIHLECKFY